MYLPRADLESLDLLSAAGDHGWTVNVDRTSVDGGVRYTFRFVAQRAMENAGVAVAFDHGGWSSDNYVMIPASVYNGNRQRIVNPRVCDGARRHRLLPAATWPLTSNPIPQLSPDFGAESLVEVLVNNAATPGHRLSGPPPRGGPILLTDQGIVRDGAVLDYGLVVEGSRAAATWPRS